MRVRPRRAFHITAAHASTKRAFSGRARRSCQNITKPCHLREHEKIRGIQPTSVRRHSHCTARFELVSGSDLSAGARCLFVVIGQFSV